MIEVGVFHNGASELPVIESPDGKLVLTDGSLKEVHESCQRTVLNQVRQGILADKLGYDYWFQTEHHFQPEGAEFSPTPLLSEMAIATNTRRIRLGQAANIITWHNPLRFAEQVAMLDIVSGGRVECGIGRGYQPRENETFGKPFGSTIQDQERNRVAFQEAYEIIIKAWTQPSFSHRGEFFSIPPSYTKWNHDQTIAYFSMDKVERNVEDILKLGAPDMYAAGNRVQATTTTLKEISVFPQPLQKPYPQLWEPLTTPRSIQWAAERGLNGYFLAEPNPLLRQKIDLYYETAEKCGWPDRLNRGSFKHGWDCEKRRGIVTARYTHLLLPGQDRERELKRFKRALELQWDYYGPFGFAALITGDPDTRVTGEMLVDQEVAIFGTPDEVGEAILRIKDVCGYEDFMFHSWFEKGGYSGEEVEAQMQHFAEEVLPGLRSACGGAPERPVADVPGFDDVRA
jgi:alkanesulfonate monooxygenase SsuD/methylene tetrahydromethanopterin reductase-like flavin-dependent oxidoreductase (luciferase family)